MMPIQSNDILISYVSVVIERNAMVNESMGNNINQESAVR